MASDQPIEANPLTDSLFRYMGLSIFYYYGLQLLLDLFTGEFTFNFACLFLFWMAYAIKDGSTTACKWGIFCMLCYGLGWIVSCFFLLFNPVELEFNNTAITAAMVPYYGVVHFVYIVWSVVNLKYLVRILKLRQVRYWTKGVIWGYAIVISLAIIFWAWGTLYNQGYSKTALEAKYADAIEYLRKAAKDEVSTFTNAPEVLALSQAHPEIISASIYTNKSSGHSIISKNDFRNISWRGNRGTGKDRDGNIIQYVMYEDYTKDQNDKWVKIKLCIRDTTEGDGQN